MDQSPQSPRITKALEFPGVIVIDSREQRPYTFTEIRADSPYHSNVLNVRTIRKALASGDYSIEGFESQIAVERKSLADLYGTLGRRRGCFQRELERLNAMDFAAVVIEAAWNDIIAAPERTQLNPVSVFRSIIAWQQRLPRVHWWAVPNRVFAERVTFRILQRFLIDQKSASNKPNT